MGLQQWMTCDYNIKCHVVGFLKIKKKKIGTKFPKEKKIRTLKMELKI